MTAAYFILEKGQKLGPFTADELMDRPLEPTDMVLAPDQTDWQAAHTLDEFTDYFKSEGIYYPTNENTTSYLLRLPAYIIDMIIITIGLTFISLIFFANYLQQLGTIFPTKILTDPDMMEKVMQQYRFQIIAMQLGLFITVVVYNAICEASKLQASVGKYIFGLAVVDDSGYSLSFGHAFMRNMGKVVYEVLGFVVGPFAYVFYLRMIWSERHQAIHDRFSGCYIVKKNQ